MILDKRRPGSPLEPQGRLVAAYACAAGSAIGDDSVPGIGDKPLAQIRPEENDHAGRFEAQPGVVTTDGEDVIWIDYDAALSMHRVRPTVAAELRLEAAGDATEQDNRISLRLREPAGALLRAGAGVCR